MGDSVRRTEPSGDRGERQWGLRTADSADRVAFCLAFVVVMMQTMSGRRFMCMGSHERGGDDLADLRRQVLELREELNRLKVAR